MPRIYRAWLVWLLALCLLVARTSLATPKQTIGVLGTVSIDLPADLGSTLQQVLMQRLRELQPATVEVRSHDLIEIQLVYGCGDARPACLARAGRQLGMSHVLFGSLRPAPAHPDWAELTLHCLATDTSESVGSLRQVIDHATLRSNGEPLRRQVDHWLGMLSLNPRVLPWSAQPFPQPRPGTWRRGFAVTALVVGVLAQATALAAIGTWRVNQDSVTGRNTNIRGLFDRLNAEDRLEPYLPLLQSPAALATCTQIPALRGDAQYDAYQAHCQRVQAFGPATHGLLIASASLAGLTMLSALLASVPSSTPSVAVHRSPAPVRPAPPQTPAIPLAPPTLWLPDPSQVPSDEPAPQGEPMRSATPHNVPRLDAISPTVGPHGVAVLVQFRF